MARDDNSRPLESTDNYQSEDASSVGRRGFLRKAAATGMIGMTGIAATTGTASASKYGYFYIKEVRQGASYEVESLDTISNANSDPVNSRIYGSNSVALEGSFENEDFHGYWFKDTFPNDRGPLWKIEGSGNLEFHFYTGWQGHSDNLKVGAFGSDRSRYWIHVDGDIQKGSAAGPNDQDRGDWVYGEILPRNIDTYTVSGPIDLVTIEGHVYIIQI